MRRRNAGIIIKIADAHVTIYASDPPEAAYRDDNNRLARAAPTFWLVRTAELADQIGADEPALITWRQGQQTRCPPWDKRD